MKRAHQSMRTGVQSKCVSSAGVARRSMGLLCGSVLLLAAVVPPEANAQSPKEYKEQIDAFKGIIKENQSVINGYFCGASHQKIIDECWERYRTIQGSGEDGWQKYNHKSAKGDLLGLVKDELQNIDELESEIREAFARDKQIHSQLKAALPPGALDGAPGEQRGPEQRLAKKRAREAARAAATTRGEYWSLVSQHAGERIADSLQGAGETFSDMLATVKSWAHKTNKCEMIYRAGGESTDESGKKVVVLEKRSLRSCLVRSRLQLEQIKGRVTSDEDPPYVFASSSAQK